MSYSTIDRATGQLMVGSAAWTSRPDANTDNEYEVTVTATDSHGESGDAVTVTITVTDVNEAPTFGAVDDDATPPVNIQGMAADHQEKTGPVTDNELDISTYTATDPEGANVTLSLMGDDAALFELAADTETGNAVNQSTLL